MAEFKLLRGETAFVDDQDLNFDTEVEAAAAYNTIAKQLFGEYEV